MKIRPILMMLAVVALATAMVLPLSAIQPQSDGAAEAGFLLSSDGVDESQFETVRSQFDIDLFNFILINPLVKDHSEISINDTVHNLTVGHGTSYDKSMVMYDDIRSIDMHIDTGYTVKDSIPDGTNVISASSMISANTTQLSNDCGQFNTGDRITITGDIRVDSIFRGSTGIVETSIGKYFSDRIYNMTGYYALGLVVEYFPVGGDAVTIDVEHEIVASRIMESIPYDVTVADSSIIGDVSSSSYYKVVDYSSSIDRVIDGRNVSLNASVNTSPVSDYDIEIDHRFPVITESDIADQMTLENIMKGVFGPSVTESDLSKSFGDDLHMDYASFSARLNQGIKTELDGGHSMTNTMTIVLLVMLAVIAVAIAVWAVTFRLGSNPFKRKNDQG
jgi:hypothetical protein